MPWRQLGQSSITLAPVSQMGEMMKKGVTRLAFGAAVAASLTMGVGSALADGYYVGSAKDTVRAPDPVAYEWNGLSVGAGIGVSRIDQGVGAFAKREDWVETYRCPDWTPDICEIWPSSPSDKHYLNTEAAGADGRDWAFFGTVQIGYDRLLSDHILVGAFADIDFYRDSNLEFHHEGYNRIKGKLERKNMWTVGGRIGFLATPRILIYGLAGYSSMKLDGAMDAYFNDPYDGTPDFADNPTNLALRFDKSVSGLTVGGGIEAKLGGRLSLKLEYRYSHLGSGSAEMNQTDYDESADWQCGAGNKHCLLLREIHEKGHVDLGDSDIHSVRAVLSFKLGRDEEPIAPLN